MKSKMTMAQMAEELGISRITISAVINGREKQQRISPETAMRVRDYLEKRGYVQSKSALQMKAGDNPKAVGILYCGDFMPFSHLNEALSHLTTEIEKRSGIVEITGITLEKLQTGLRDLVGKGVTRLIWIHANSGEIEMRNMEILRPLLERMDRVVCYNSRRRNEYHGLPENLSTIGFDRNSAYIQVAEYWQHHGYTKIALSELFYDANGGLPNTPQLREVFLKHDFEVFGLHPAAIAGLPDQQVSEIMANNLVQLHRSHQVNCAFIRNEFQAAMIMQKLMAQGIRIPEDIAVIGFGYNPYLEMLPVSLTTFAQPVKEMCDKAIELLYNPEATSGDFHDFKNRMVIGHSHGK